MKKIVWAVVALWASVPVNAQVMALDPIIVSFGSKAESSGSAYPHLAARDYPEYLLSDFSAVDVQKKGTSGFLQDVSIRGGIFEDADVHFDGISLNNPQTGHFNLSIPVVSLDVAAAEINSNGQSVDFHLLWPQDSQTIVKIAGGNAGYGQGAVSTSIQSGDVFHRFSSEEIRTDGLLDETDGHKEVYAYTLNYQNCEDQWRFYGAWMDKHFAEGGAYSAPWYMKEEERLRQVFFMGQWHRQRNWQIDVKPFWHFTKDIFLLDRDRPQIYRNDHHTLVMGLQERITFPNETVYLRHEFSRESIDSSNLGAHIRFLQETGIGINRREWNRFFMEAEMVVTYPDEFPLNMEPRVMLGYDISGRATIDAQALRKYRVPSFTELYYDSPTNQGLATLEPQKTDNVEIGWNYKADGMVFRVDGFYRWQKDTIDWGRNFGDAYYQAQNAGEVDFYGSDLSVRTKLPWRWFDVAEIQYTRLQASRVQPFDVSKYAFQYLRDRLIARLSGTWQKMGYQTDFVYEYHSTLKSRFQINSQFSYDLGQERSLFVAVENVLDEDYYEAPYIDALPFSVKAGIIMKF